MKKSFLFLPIFIFVVSCSKFLDKKPDMKLSDVNSLEDCQALLDRNLYLNQSGVGAMEESADNYYLNEDLWSSLSEENRNLYTWQPYNLFSRYVFTGNDWSNCYDNIFRSNFVLESVEKFKNNGDEYENVKGQAYFIRAHHYLQAAWTWCLSYDKENASSNLGLPLRLATNFNVSVERSNIEETYSQIISDCNKAIDLLPLKPKHVLRPSKPAAYALLARVYMSMNIYDSCYKYSQLSFDLKSDLLNFNDPLDVAPLSNNPFSNFNKEVIFEYASISNLTYRERSFVDSNLVLSYSEHDIRKSAFFISNGKHFKFKGSYSNNSNFAGITTAEVLLMKAESSARLGNISSALIDFNLFRKHRIENSFFVPAEISDNTILIDSILNERRRELLMRGLRFIDIKRLNVMGANISLKRFINGKEYSLPANDFRFALAIPEDVIANSKIQQNPR